MFNPNGYLYVRPTYSNKRYVNKGRIKIKLENGKILYLYFDKFNHMNYTENVKYATSFYTKPKNYSRYVECIQKRYPNSEVTMDWKVITKDTF